jgi:hypothetical protein
VGSRSKIDLAYIAGFLDGDGSLMLQLKKRSDGKLKYRFMSTICFYQDSRHEESLHWIKNIIGIGYISKRNDGMTELRINGFKQTGDIIRELLPFIRFKQEQAKAILRANDILSSKSFNLLTKNELKKIISCIQKIQTNNYKSKRKRSGLEISKILGLTP